MNSSEYNTDLAFMKEFVSSIKRVIIRRSVRRTPYERRQLANEIQFDFEDKEKFIGLLEKYEHSTFYIMFKSRQYYGYLIRDMQLFDEEDILTKDINDIEKLFCQESKCNIFGKIYKFGSSKNKDCTHSVHWLFEIENIKILDPDLIKAYEYIADKIIMEDE